MTRVNVVPPSTLSNQHLFAEWREIRHIPPSLRRSLESRTVEQILAAIPPKYVLGAGHKTFFYDKLFFLEKRFYALRHELACRGFNFNHKTRFYPEDFCVSLRLINDYVPDADAIALNQARIDERIAIKPDWYRWTKPRTDLKFDRRLDHQRTPTVPFAGKKAPHD